MKFYAVQKGRNTGIFTSWDECKANVNGYKGAIFKSFQTRQEAEAFLGENFKTIIDTESSILVYVDGSFMNNIVGSGIRIIYPNGEIEDYIASPSGPYTESRNVYGELNAVIEALLILHLKTIDEGLFIDSIIIYHDYMGIANHVDGTWRLNKRSSEEYAEKVRQLKTILGISNLSFVHVAAHSNNEHNDAVDELAKYACTRDGQQLINNPDYFINNWRLTDLLPSARGTL